MHGIFSWVLPTNQSTNRSTSRLLLAYFFTAVTPRLDSVFETINIALLHSRMLLQPSVPLGIPVHDSYDQWHWVMRVGYKRSMSSPSLSRPTASSVGRDPVKYGLNACFLLPTLVASRCSSQGALHLWGPPHCHIARLPGWLVAVDFELGPREGGIMNGS